MVAQIKMPALSPTMTEGKLSKWLIKKSSKVVSGDVIAEIETDKATMEIEAVDDGILYEIFVEEGTDNVAVGSTLALIKEDSDTEDQLNSFFEKNNTNNLLEMDKEKIPDINSKTDKAIHDINVDEKIMNLKENITKDERIKISPLAKKIAQKNNVNFSTLLGTGPHGRIVKKDIEDFIISNKNISSIDSYNKSSSDTTYRDVTHSPMRKIIADRLVKSATEAPHFFLSVDCDISEINKIRKNVNIADTKISVNDFIIKASALALKKCPKANCSWNNDYIRYYNSYDISVAVAVEDGLITPIVKNATGKGIEEISSEVKLLALKAKKGELSPEEYSGGNFTVSNLGMFGIKNFNAIINPPQSMILAVGKAEPRAIVSNNEITISNLMTVTLSCDHRAVDGALGAQWLNKFKGFIENPSLMLL
ncbi:pyruvate dehydrogenase complex dihydrolipoamide acetyltransferase [SAR116 cluster bacterium]|nr:pyruvate dehydrogenase complex dihydrolipoamide acetyltransferase [SAR116 cluster bacterium]